MAAWTRHGLTVLHSSAHPKEERNQLTSAQRLSDILPPVSMIGRLSEYRA